MLLLAVLLLALGGVLWILWAPGKRSSQPSGKERLASREFATRLNEAPGAGGRGPSPEGGPRAPEPDAPLDPARVTRLVMPALALLDLRKDDDRPLRETRGVLVDANGAVLCRLSALLGAHHGTCRFLGSDAQRIEIVGVAFSAEPLDLALVRVAHVPEGTTPLSILADPPDRALADGEAVFAVTTSKVMEAAVGNVHWVGVDRVIRVLLDDNPLASPEAFLAIDSYGFVLGLLKVEVEGRFVPEGKPRPPQGYRLLVDPAYTVVQGVGRNASITLAELTLRLYEGTFDDLFTRGTAACKQEKWKEAVEFLEQALGRATIDQPDTEDVSRATEQLRQSYLEEVRRLTGAKRNEEAVGLAQTALGRFANDVELLLMLGELRVAQRDWAGGIVVLAQARALDPNERVDDLLEKAYLEMASEAGRTGDSRTQENQLLQAVQQLPSSGDLHLELGKLYAHFEAYDAAEQYLNRALELDSSLRETVENLLARIDDARKRRDSVVVPIPPGSNAIRTQADLDGRVSLEFIIDTGASYTGIPASVAESLGYDTKSDKYTHIPISTANGTVVVPLIPIQSINLGGYVVHNIEVLVFPPGSGAGDNRGLIGLNFLRNFKYTIDASRHELRLERP